VTPSTHVSDGQKGNDTLLEDANVYQQTEEAEEVFGFALLGGVVELQHQGRWKLPLGLQQVHQIVVQRIGCYVCALLDVGQVGARHWRPSVREHAQEVDVNAVHPLGVVVHLLQVRQLKLALVGSVNDEAEVLFGEVFGQVAPKVVGKALLLHLEVVGTHHILQHADSQRVVKLGSLLPEENAR
jgi:hypothetical protein